MFNKKNVLPEIHFISTVLGLENIEDIKPKQSKYFMPNWWSSVPNKYNNSQTVKQCPSFTDFFSQGYIIPAWQDIELKYDKNKKYYEYKTASIIFPNVEKHDNDQFLNHVDAQVNGTSIDFIFKLDSPWKVITPKGYSILQIPLFYHFDNKFSALPGIIDSDILHDINIQITYPAETPELFIKRGTPLAMLIPFKREKYKFEVRDQTDADIKKIKTSKINLDSRFIASYRRMQKQRDNGL